MALPGAPYIFSGLNVVCTVSMQPLTVFQDGDTVEIELNEDQFKPKVGTTGELTYSRTNNYLATITFHLMQTSPANDFLWGLMLADLQSPIGSVVPIMVADTLGTTRFNMTYGRCTKAPKWKASLEAGGVDWVYQGLIPPAAQWHGGNLPSVVI